MLTLLKINKKYKKNLEAPRFNFLRLITHKYRKWGILGQIRPAGTANKREKHPQSYNSTLRRDCIWNGFFEVL
jgi:hypothetical protein